MKSTLKPYHNKLKALFAQHIRPTAESSQPQDEPITEMVEPIVTVTGPEPTDPPPHDEKALTEEVARQIGWQVGDKVTGAVSNRQMVNKNRVWATVPGWSEQVQVSVHSRDEWPAGSRIKCEYVQANSDGHLVFNSKEHGPKWKKRGSR
jgi:hypothetical protein